MFIYNTCVCVYEYTPCTYVYFYFYILAIKEFLTQAETDRYKHIQVWVCVHACLAHTGWTTGRPLTPWIQSRNDIHNTYIRWAKYLKSTSWPFLSFDFKENLVGQGKKEQSQALKSLLGMGSAILTTGQITENSIRSKEGPCSMHISLSNCFSQWHKGSIHSSDQCSHTRYSLNPILLDIFTKF